MEKYLVFEDGTSRKFWHVRVESNNVVITFGRIGTAGQTQIKAYPSAADAEKDAAKQAAGKLKKGYVEATIPEDAPAPASAAKTTVAKTPADKKAAAKPGAGPADLADDGKPKPWHGEDGWDYSWFYNDDVFAHIEEELDEPRYGDEPEPKKQAPKPAAADDEDLDIEFDEDDDEDDRRRKREKARMAKLSPEQMLAERRENVRQYLTDKGKEATDEAVDKEVRHRLLYYIGDTADASYKYRDCEKHIAVLRLLIADDKEYKTTIVKALNDAIKELIEESYSLNDKEMEQLFWLLEQGAEICGKPELRIVKAFVAGYKKNPDPARARDIWNNVQTTMVANMLPEYAKGFRDTVREFIAGEYNEGVWPADSTHFVIRMGGVKPNDGKFWKRFENDKCGIGEGEFDTELIRQLPALLQPMAEAGEFDGLKDKGLFVLAVKSEDGRMLLRRVIDQKRLDERVAELEKLIVYMEGVTDFENTEEQFRTAVAALLDGIYMPVDLPRARALIQKFIYSLHIEAQKAGISAAWDYRYRYPELRHDWALFKYRSGNFTGGVNHAGSGR